jgi:hypothetical protein
MREFAQVLPTFWTGDTGRAIKGRPELQTLALYLITCPHANAFGLYYLPLPFITHETGLTEKKILAGFKELSDFCRYDTASEFVWVIGMAGFQIGNMEANDNRMKGLQRAWQGLPANPFTADFWAKYGERYGFERRASKGLAKGLPRAFEGSGSPQIIETETETETETVFPFEEIWTRYPDKDGKKDAERHFRASVRNREDFEAIGAALDNYLASEKVRKGFIKNGSTWFNNWRDWVTVSPPARQKSVTELLMEKAQ